MKNVIITYIFILHFVSFYFSSVVGQKVIPCRLLDYNNNNVYCINLENYDFEYPDLSNGTLLKHPTNVPKKIILNLNPDDFYFWEEAEGKKYLKLCFYNPLASEMAFVFSPYKVSNGVKIIFYNEENNILHGALSSLNNKKSEILPLKYLKGNKIYMEIQIPDSVTDHGNYTIKNVYIKYSERKYKNADFDYCMNDVSCFNLPVIEKAKDGVCRIKIKGYKDCTGALINNENNDGKPYLLTANHCIADQDEADNSVFIFQDEKVSCNCDITLPQKSIASATLLSTSKEYDFSLLQLSITPDQSYNPLYLGWNISDETFDNVSCIHHTDGGYKKISVELNSIELTTFNEVVDYFAENAHWKIRRWDIGSTSGGSSGGPLVDSEGRIIGILSGGSANCNNPVNDYFVNISLAWSAFQDTTRQLKYWLNRNYNSFDKIDSYRPFEKYNNVALNNCDTNYQIDNKFYIYPIFFENYIVIFSNNNSEVESNIKVLNLIGQIEDTFRVTLKPGDNIIELRNYKKGFHFLIIGNMNKIYKVCKL